MPEPLNDNPSSEHPADAPHATAVVGGAADLPLPDSIPADQGLAPLDIDAQIDQLIAEVEQSAGDAAALVVGSEAPAAPAAASALPAEPVPEPTPAPAVAAAAQEPNATSGPVVDAAPTTSDAGPTGADEAGAKSLADELESALAEATGALEQITPPEDPPAGVSPATAAPTALAPTSAPAPVAEVAAPVSGTPSTTHKLDEGSIADLDAALAEQAADLEAASRHQEDVAAAAPETAQKAPPPPEPPAESAPIAEQPALESVESPGEPIDAQPVEAPSPTMPPPVTPAEPAIGSTPAAPALGKPTSAHQTVPRPAPHRAARVNNLSKSARTAVSRVGVILAKPMSLVPESMREVVTYFALVTAFNAAAVWFYILFLHTPAEPVSHEHGAVLHASDEEAAHAGHAEGTSSNETEGSEHRDTTAAEHKPETKPEAPETAKEGGHESGRDQPDKPAHPPAHEPAHPEHTPGHE